MSNQNITNGTVVGNVDDVLFHWADYLLFALSLISTIVVGVVFAIKDRVTSQTTESYLLGNRHMDAAPVAASMVSSSLNAIFFIGGVAELQYFGFKFNMMIIGFVIGFVLAAWFIVPFYRNLNYKFTSAYEYFGRRFHLAVRMLASVLFIIATIILLALVLYAPSLALAQVSHITNVNLCIVIVGIVCASYTVLGGIRAVVWVDTIQTCILFVAMVTLAAMGLQNVGGFQKAWQRYGDSGRLDVDDFSLLPWDRNTMWSVSVGHGVLWLSVCSSNQMMVQRYLAVSSTSSAQLALMFSAGMFVLMYAIVTCLGLAIFSYYDCDPRISGRIARADQLLPLFIMDTIGHLHGIPGLVFAGLFAAALSTVSSCINSLAAVFLEDILKPIYRFKQQKVMEPRLSGIFIKIFALIFSLLSILLALTSQLAGEFLFPLTVNAFGLVGAPLFGAFILGWFFPCANAIGVILGLLSSLAFGMTLFVGSVLYGSNQGWDLKTPRTDGCPVGVLHAMTNRPRPAPPGEPTFYDVSNLWAAILMIIVCVLVGLGVSLLTHCIRGRSSYRSMYGTQDPNLLYPCGHLCFCCCVNSRMHSSYCGIPFAKPSGTSQDESCHLHVLGGNDSKVPEGTV